MRTSESVGAGSAPSRRCVVATVLLASLAVAAVAAPPPVATPTLDPDADARPSRDPGSAT